jgi:hypothetical protein
VALKRSCRSRHSEDTGGGRGHERYQINQRRCVHSGRRLFSSSPNPVLNIVHEKVGKGGVAVINYAGEEDGGTIALGATSRRSICSGAQQRSPNSPVLFPQLTHPLLGARWSQISNNMFDSLRIETRAIPVIMLGTFCRFGLRSSVLVRTRRLYSSPSSKTYRCW